MDDINLPVSLWPVGISEFNKNSIVPAVGEQDGIWMEYVRNMIHSR